MTIAAEIHDALIEAFAPAYLDVINESHQHNVPAGSESHFKVVIVSDVFATHSLISRHRQVNQSLAAQLAGPVHALSMHTHTQEEWQARGRCVPASPPCRGGSGSK